MSVFYQPPRTTRSFTTPTSNDVFVLTGNDSLSLSSDSGSTVVLIGSSNSLQFLSGNVSGESIVDAGQGSSISFIGGFSGSIDVYGFQNDPTGNVHVGNTGGFAFNYSNNGSTGPQLPSDGHGGSIARFGGGAIDFHGDPHVFGGVPRTTS